ncbi:aminotransferase-like domain-containing protein [Paenibacillus massiliensis]|uniref:aminotransferase-like domain-containing protein n=1 Tax=Paenibacillus massiliensis TaxID=225917 RepID=UPI0006871574|nr:PLP-dependent aminotransferase family protein [Paenibacillus massiliensis]
MKRTQSQPESAHIQSEPTYIQSESAHIQSEPAHTQSESAYAQLGSAQSESAPVQLKYASIAADLRTELLNRRIPRGVDGYKLPSVRVLAARYQCSKSTVLQAYAELEREHLVYSLPKSGYFAVTSGPDSRSAQDEGGPLDFASAAPDPRVFPYVDFQHCINQAIDNYRTDLFVYGTSQGLPSLRALLQERLTDHQVFTRREQICVTSGVQQALAVLITMPFPNKKSGIVIEDPGYHNMFPLLRGLQASYYTVPRHLDGLDMDRLEQLLQTGEIKFIYVMPRFHNPLGVSLTIAQKQRLIELAQHYDSYIVEDDYLADLDTDSKRDPVYAYDRSGRVIYLKSFSKIIFPGLRLGVAVLPAELIESFAHYKTILDIDSSTLSQAALEIYIRSGMYDRHRRGIREQYTARMKMLNSMLDRLGDHPAFAEAPRNGGEHTVLPLPANLSYRALLSGLSKRGVHADTANRYFADQDRATPLLRLNISNVHESQIERGLVMVREELERLDRRKR